MTRQFPRIFWWHVARNLRRHPLLAALNVLSIALGIAVYLAIQVANHSANRSFAATVDLVAGKAHVEIRGDVDETLWPTIARQPGVRATTALVESVVTLPDFPGEYLRILGVDTFTSEPFRTFELSGSGKHLDLDRWLGQPGQIALSADFAERYGLKKSDELRVLVNGEHRALTILSLIDAAGSPAEGQQRFAAMDLGWAQELFRSTGRISSMQLLVDEPSRAAQVAEALRPLLPPSLSAQPPRQRSFQLQRMISAFQLNLTALSMVSMLVGVFLIYNTISASVARRRIEIGILRALGTSRTEVRALFLGEAALFGLVGIVLGAGGGLALAQVLTGTVAKTISSLYVLVSIDRSYLNPLHFIAAAGYGIGAVLIGAWLPANGAAKIDPVAALSSGAHAERSASRAFRWTWLGTAALLLSLFLSWVALRGAAPVFSFLAAFCVLIGFAFFAHRATALFALGVAGSAPHAILLRLSAENLARSLHRNSVTVAALAAAIAMTIGLTVMIFSFRQSVNAWIDRGIVADLFIAPASNETIGLSAAVPQRAIAWLEARSEVEAVDTFREEQVSVSVAAAPPEAAVLAVIRGAYRGNLTFVGGNEDAKMALVFGGQAIAVTEPFARKFRVREGDHVRIITPQGPVQFAVAGVYSDYTRDQGVMLMDRRAFDRYWDNPAVQSMAVYLRETAAAEPVAEAFRAEFSREGEYAIYSNRSLRTRILTVFDQTFAVTYVLRTVALLVAIAGIFLSVTTLVFEREREIGVLRAIGASRTQIQRLFITESGMIGVVATVLGLSAGVALAATLTWVVNPAFFGWTIRLQFPWRALVATPFWILPATLLAAWYPAWRASQTPIARAVREE